MVTVTEGTGKAEGRGPQANRELEGGHHTAENSPCNTGQKQELSGAASHSVQRQMNLATDIASVSTKPSRASAAIRSSAVVLTEAHQPSTATRAAGEEMYFVPSLAMVTGTAWPSSGTRRCLTPGLSQLSGSVA